MQSPRDENRAVALIGVLNTDGLTIKTVYVNPSNHAMKVVNDTTGSDFGNKQAVRDENRIPISMAVSSTDGKTLVPLYVDSSNNLLIKST